MSHSAKYLRTRRIVRWVAGIAFLIAVILVWGYAGSLEIANQ